jgi:hypothetical protein
LGNLEPLEAVLDKHLSFPSFPSHPGSRQLRSARLAAVGRSVDLGRLLEHPTAIAVPNSATRNPVAPTSSPDRPSEDPPATSCCGYPLSTKALHRAPIPHTSASGSSGETQHRPTPNIYFDGALGDPSIREHPIHRIETSRRLPNKRLESSHRFP